MDLLRSQGFRVYKTEHWDHYAKKTKDLYGFIDILGVRSDMIMAVQTTDYTSVSKRYHKIIDERWDNYVALEAHWVIQIHGWRKHKGRWQVRVVTMNGRDHKRSVDT
jgi:hypothetical protein